MAQATPSFIAELVASASTMPCTACAGAMRPVAASCAADAVAACTSARPETASVASNAAGPSQASIAAEPTSTAATTATNSKTWRGSKARPSSTPSWPSATREVQAATPANASTTAPADSSGQARGTSRPGASAATTIPICTMVLTFEAMAPLALAVASAGRRRARAPIPPIVAVLDTKPPASPASNSPARGPNARSATWPAALIAITSTASSHSLRRLRTCQGSRLRSGNSGSTIAAAAASNKASCSSWSVSTRCTKRWTRDFAASSRATPTPSPAARASSRMASTPSRNTTSIATSVVRPGSASRLPR